MSIEEQKAISEMINRFARTIEGFAKDTCIFYLKNDWVMQREHTRETVHIQSTVEKVIKYLLAINTNNKKIQLLYEKAKKLYARCDELLDVIDPQ